MSILCTHNVQPDNQPYYRHIRQGNAYPGPHLDNGADLQGGVADYPYASIKILSA